MLSWTAVSVRLPLRHLPPFSLSSLLASSTAWHSQLLSASSLCHLAMIHSASSTTPRYQIPAFLAAVGYNTVSTPNTREKLSVDPSVARNTLRSSTRHWAQFYSYFLVGPVPDPPHQPSSQTSPGRVVARCLSAVQPPQRGDTICGWWSRRARIAPSRGPLRTT